MKFRAYVEPAEPMRGLEVPPEVVESLGGGKRPRVIITVNGHSWQSRVAIMRGRYLLGLSNANRQAAGVVTGDEVEVEVEFDAEPPVVVEPADFARALDADPAARAAYDRLAHSHKREHVLAIESAKKPETRLRRIEKAMAMLRGDQQAELPRRLATTPPQMLAERSIAHVMTDRDSLLNAVAERNVFTAPWPASLRGKGADNDAWTRKSQPVPDCGWPETFSCGTRRRHRHRAGSASASPHADRAERPLSGRPGRGDQGVLPPVG